MIRPEAVPLIAASVVTVVAATTDLWKFKVYNALTLPTLIGGVFVSWWIGGLSGLGSSLLGAAIGFFVLAAFFALGGVGAGDVKLFAALGAWLGPWPTMQVFAASAMCAGGYALVLCTLSRGVGEAAVQVAVLGHRMISPGLWSKPEVRIDAEVRRDDRRRRLVPFAATTCLGFFAMLALWHANPGASR
jgi:prepilin peptidase CpaA